MTPADIVIAVLAAAVVIGTVVGVIRRRKKGGCSCGCSNCTRECDKRNDNKQRK